MKKHYLLFLLLAVLCSTSCFNIQAQCLSGGRYYDPSFQVDYTYNIPYGKATRFDGVDTVLKLNFYQPAGDTVQKVRPLIIFAFGGSFTSGFKGSPDIVRLCQEFAARGYVAASIDYRLGFEGGNDSDTNQFKALIRGVQDMRAAVRFFYKDAQTTNTYRVDTSKIFIGGVSAGAFIALNYAYFKLDTLSFPAPAFAIQAFLDLGGLEGNSGNPGYSTKVRGVIDLCGAIADTVWIMPKDPPMVGVHGTADALVACEFDSAKAAQTTESRLFGGCDIKHRLSHINTTSSFYLFEGAGHVPFILPCGFAPPCTDYMDTTIWIIRDFLYRQLCYSPLAVNEENSDLPVSVFPNPAEDRMTFTSHHEKALTLTIYGTDGRLLLQKNVEQDVPFTLFRHELSSGLFLYQFREKESGANYRTGKVVFY